MELMLGLAITGLVGLCAATLVSATSKTWQAQQQDVSATTATGRTRSFLERAIHNAQDVGYWADGTGAEPATLLLWANDQFAHSGAAALDHQPQLYELTLLRYDASAKRLVLYRPRAWTSLSTSQQSAASLKVAVGGLTNQATADQLRAADWVEEIPVLGNAAAPVTSGWLAVDRTFERPLVRYRFDQLRLGTAVPVKGIISLRARAADDNWTKDLHVATSGSSSGPSAPSCNSGTSGTSGSD